MARKDDLDTLIDEIEKTDPAVRARVAAALERRELARALASRRREAGLTQTTIARRMGTSQGQVARFESGADTRLSTVSRYAEAVGMRVVWTLSPAKAGAKGTASKSASRSTRKSNGKATRKRRGLARVAASGAK